MTPAGSGLPAACRGRLRLAAIPFPRLLPAEEPDDGTDDDHGDTDAVADTRAPVVHPAEQQEFHVQEMQHEMIRHP